MYDCIVIGGGVIGLSVGRHFALAGRKTAILEAHQSIEEGISFRNSAVVHAGIYYPSDSLKARFCLEGKSLLKSYCESHEIPYKTIGKLIIAKNESQLNQLHSLQKQAQQNGVAGVVILNQSELQAKEPAVKGVAAIYSPNTAVLDGNVLITSLKKDFLLAGGHFYTKTIVSHAVKSGTSFKIITNNPHHIRLRSRFLVNSAGILAQEVARNIKGLCQSTLPPLYMAKGNYFKYQAASPFNHLIYPLPEAAGLGIHATLDVKGQVRFGPDVEWIEKIDYKTNIKRKQLFVDEIKQYYPGLKEEALVPDDQHTGIRPKIAPPHEQPQDFLIHTDAHHNVKGLINLFGMESPGLTAALAVARFVYHNLHV